MKKETLKAKVEEIRRLIMKSDLDGATEKLTELAANFGEDAHDEAVTISANWNQLEREIRTALIHEKEARVRQNQLIDRILDFSRDLEKYKTAPLQEAKTASKKTVLLVVAGIIGLLLAFFLLKPLLTSPELAVPEKAVESSAVNKPAKAKEQPETTGRTTIQTPARELPKVPVESKPSSLPEDTPLKPAMKAYNELYASGLDAYNDKQYDLAYKQFSAALNIQKTEEVMKYMRPLKETLYNKYRIKGMDFYNAGNYKSALKEFKTAQTFKDFSAIRGLIKKCEERLR